MDESRTVACSCGAVVPVADLEEHLATHGVERDTYVAALARKVVDDEEDGGTDWDASDHK